MVIYSVAGDVRAAHDEGVHQIPAITSRRFV